MQYGILLITEQENYYTRRKSAMSVVVKVPEQTPDERPGMGCRSIDGSEPNFSGHSSTGEIAAKTNSTNAYVESASSYSETKRI